MSNTEILLEEIKFYESVCHSQNVNNEAIDT